MRMLSWPNGRRKHSHANGSKEGLNEERALGFNAFKKLEDLATCFTLESCILSAIEIRYA